MKRYDGGGFDLEKVTGEEVCGSAGGLQEGLPRDGHAHCGKLGEVVDQAVHALHEAAGQANQQAASLLLCLLPRTACQGCTCSRTVIRASVLQSVLAVARREGLDCQHIEP